jgi:hypothetical protein
VANPEHVERLKQCDKQGVVEKKGTRAAVARVRLVLDP